MLLLCHSHTCTEHHHYIGEMSSDDVGANYNYVVAMVIMIMYTQLGYRAQLYLLRNVLIILPFIVKTFN